MANPTLLADLAWRLASSPEDVATEALTLILGRSVHAREAMNQLIAVWTGSAGCSVARWRSQVVTTDKARTDMQGEDGSGVVRIILENKFDAALTPNQPATYLQRLPTDDAVLAFVAPSTRLASLVIEVVDRALRAGFGKLQFRSAGPTQIADVNERHKLVITSWGAVLGAIASALQAAEDNVTLADVRQLQGLVEKVDTERFLPLTPNDTTGAAGRRILQFNQILDAVWSRISCLPAVSQQGLGTVRGPGHYGKNFTAYGFGCLLIFWAKHWAKYGISPIWLRIADGDWTFPEGLEIPLTTCYLIPSGSRQFAREAGQDCGCPYV